MAEPKPKVKKTDLSKDMKEDKITPPVSKAPDEGLVTIKLVKGHVTHKGVTHNCGPVPFKIEKSVADHLLKIGVAVIPIKEDE